MSDNAIPNFLKEYFVEQNSLKKDEIFPVNYDNKKYWIKKARPTSSNLFHKLAYKLFTFDVLLPVESKNLNAAINFETNKIIRFAKKGINTPKVCFANEKFFVLEDCGNTVNSYIRKRDITKEKMYYFVDELLKELSKIHNNGEFHGGAQARNFTFFNNKIFVLDLEDSFDSKIELTILQFRDLILLLLSFTKTRASFEVDYEYIIEKYILLCPQNKEFRNKLKVLANKISFFIALSQNNIINKIIGRDGRAFFKLFLILKNLGDK